MWIGGKKFKKPWQLRSHNSTIFVTLHIVIKKLYRKKRHACQLVSHVHVYLFYRRVYIAYLDSVHFFQPREFRTAVYHEMLIGYLDYVKSLG